MRAKRAPKERYDFVHEFVIRVFIGDLHAEPILCPDSLREREKELVFERFADSDGLMVRGGFLSEQNRKAVVGLARDNLSTSHVARRANAPVPLDDGMSCQKMAKVLLFDELTIRGWRELFERERPRLREAL